MKSIAAHFFISVGVAFLLSKLQTAIGSVYILDFLNKNLIAIQIALMAINGTTLGIVLTKVREITDRTGSREAFMNSKREMLFMVYEQISLIAISLILLSLHTSSWIAGKASWLEVFEVLIIGCFVYAMIILYDTAKSVFVLIDFEDNEA